MFPGAFDYRAPTSLDEVLELLREHGEEAKVLAGGQSLIPLLKLRLASPSLLVDIGRVPGLQGMARADGTLVVGARTRHVDVERASLPAGLEILQEAAPQISDPLVRNLGTIGGSLCHADPAGDWGSVAIALGAGLVLRSPRGERTVEASAFFQGPFTTALAADEVLTEIRFPVPAGPAAGTYLKLERKVGDFATVGVALQVEMDGGRVRRAGIGLTAVAPTNLRAQAAEDSLAGSELDDAAIVEAARLAAGAADPRDDIRGSAAYKRDVVRVFVQRGLRTLRQRLGEVGS
ncbi:MAG TPA: xanthine dehydrogenase family protein subunit M [Candidatus Dormibacteraeota bacterium]|nr:xanthine dehydrogenase family protein subunit M [Candidatus Dormibacteraeota bacterium]